MLGHVTTMWSDSTWRVPILNMSSVVSPGAPRRYFNEGGGEGGDRTLSKKSLCFLHDPKKIPASFIDPNKSLLPKMSDPKNPSDLPSVKYVSGAPGVVYQLFIYSHSPQDICSTLQGRTPPPPSPPLSLSSPQVPTKNYRTLR